MTTFGELAEGDRFRVLPAGGDYRKVRGLALPGALPESWNGYDLAEDRRVYPVE